jgi:pumilio RNA-binding family
VVAFCQDQHGSRFIQQRLEVCSDVDKQLIFDEIIPSAHLLMTDVFGNYVLQKLFEYGSPEQCETLAQLLTGQSVQLAMQMYGCRVVQKALEYVSTQRLIALVSEFESPPVRSIYLGRHQVLSTLRMSSNDMSSSVLPIGASPLRA